jgi:hypothetical protein
MCGNPPPPRPVAPPLDIGAYELPGLSATASKAAASAPGRRNTRREASLDSFLPREANA